MTSGRRVEFMAAQRFLCRVAYVGTAYIGWASQLHCEGVATGHRAVQTALNDALDRFVGAEHHDGIVGSSRTDKGVHALANTFHIDVRKPLTAYEVKSGFNWHLGAEHSNISVIDATPVADDVHARFSAVGREYHYRIIAPREPSARAVSTRALPLHAERAWLAPYALDVDAMRTAARHLIGTHDFSSFRASRCQAASPVRSIDELVVSTSEDRDPFAAASIGSEMRAINVGVKAPGFLYHQVRNIVGCLNAVGRGQMEPDDIGALLAARDRRAAPAMAPATGLYLAGVQYA